MSDQKKTQRERLNESLARKREALDKHQVLCQEILAEIEAGDNDESMDFFALDRAEFGAESDPFIQYPIEVTHIETHGDTLWSETRGGTGAFVSVRPCSKIFEGKTYFGIYLGDLAGTVSVQHYKDSGILQIVPTMHNPAIFVPDLNRIIMGCESWWGEIKCEDDLKAISDVDIQDVWYVKALAGLSTK